MIVRELTGNRVLLLGQEDHADVSAQFAAHWGNEQFARLQPYDTMVFGTIYHDSQFRPVEAALAIHPERGRPYGHRELGASPERWEALRANLAWLRERDPYAGLVVSMHHTGLAQGRYGTIKSGRSGGAGRPMRPDVQSEVEQLEAAQREQMQALGLTEGAGQEVLWTNYRYLQVFDLLSLYFCCDGYRDGELQEETITPVPLGYGGEDEVELQLIPLGGDRVRVTPYPFDVSPLRIGVAGRTMQPRPGAPDDECRQAYWAGERTPLTWELVR
jgi:hypothetical protein